MVHLHICKTKTDPYQHYNVTIRHPLSVVDDIEKYNSTEIFKC